MVSKTLSVEHIPTQLFNSSSKTYLSYTLYYTQETL